MTSQTLCITVTDRKGQNHEFISTGLHEEFTYLYNDYTGELTVERVEFGPRGNDEWARLSTVVVATWADGLWNSVTRHSPGAPR